MKYISTWSVQRKFICYIQGFNALICAATWLNLQDSCKDMIKCIYDSGKDTVKSILNRQDLYKDMVKSTWIVQSHDEKIRLTQQYNWNYKTHEKTGLNLCDEWTNLHKGLIELIRKNTIECVILIHTHICDLHDAMNVKCMMTW